MNKEVKFYWPLNYKTKEVLMPVQAEFRGGTYHIPRDALQSEPLAAKKGFAVVATLDECSLIVGTEYIEDHRGETIYNQEHCDESSIVDAVGPIRDGWTTLTPKGLFCEWINNAWVTNQNNKYIHEYDQVDTTRRSLYSQRCDPLVSEANIKRLQGNEAEAEELEAQALAAWQNIHDEHPWPEREEQ